MMRGAKVLILMTSPLDKIVHALRVVESIQRRVPTIEVTWVVRHVYEPLVAAFDFVDHTIVFKRREGLINFSKLLVGIRSSYYDFVLDFEGHARTGAMCFFARGRRKIGLRSAREGATICYREVVAGGLDDTRHLLERLQDFSAVFGLTREMGESLPFYENWEPPEVWGAAGTAGRRRICLFPGRFKSERAWPEMFDLARRLVADHEMVEVFMLGIVPSRSVGELPDRVHDLQEQLSWPDLCLALREADIVVANDNGPAQLAGALGCRNLTLYSYVSPEMRGSYPVGSPVHSVVRAPGGCVQRLDLDTVYSKVEKLLDL